MTTEQWEVRDQLRFRVPSAERKAALTCQVSILIGARDAALTDELGAEFERFETAVAPLIDREDSWLAGVFSKAGSREWCFYAAEWNAFIAKFNDVLSTAPRFTLTVQYSADPNWKYFSFLKSGFTDPR